MKKVSKMGTSLIPEHSLSMEMEVELALFGDCENCVRSFSVCTSGKFNQIGPKKVISCNF